MQISANPLSRVYLYPQDARSSPLEEDGIDAEKIGRRLHGDRISVWDQEVMKASADAQGNYLIKPDNRRFEQVQAFVSAHKTLDLFEGFARRKLPWAFESPTLGVGPHAGQGANAYYQRFAESLSFYYFDSKALGKTVYTAQSSDIVSHETGHAILDGLKPQYGHTFDRETKAFHEAFGDCAAMLLTLARPSTCQQILEECGGDLSRENCLSRLGEEFGAAVRRFNNNPDDDREYLRTHLNPFVYVDPNTLPSDGPRDELSGESHSFCQVWTRAFYDLIVRLHEGGDPALSPAERLQQAGAQAGQWLLLATQMTSPARARFDQVAGAMLAADQCLQQGRHQQIFEAAFASAGIQPKVEVVPEFNWQAPPGNQAEGQEILRQLGFSDLDCQRVIQDGHGFTYIEGLRKDTRCFENLGVSAEIGTGVTLTFDAQGRLKHLAKDPEASEEAGLKDDLAHETLLQVLRRNSHGQPVLQRAPVFVD